MDSVALARQERDKQGPWEVEVSYGGEVDLYKHLNSCSKNPGHLKFVPIDKFNMDHLPPGYQDKNLVDLVQAVADLTVQVSVKFVSEKRPKRDPHYSSRGRYMLSVGTGRVCWVDKYPNMGETDYKTCTCNECVSSRTPKKQFAHINIITAAHVVYDSREGAHTTCHLFFDRGNTPDSCKDVVKLNAMSCVTRFNESDRSEMIYVTHDMDLANRLDNMVYCFKHRMEKLLTSNPSPLIKRQKLLPETELLHAMKHPLTIIVSHPHGCSKQVSIGHCMNTTYIKDGWTWHKYTTATCSGSSGANVLVPWATQQWNWRAIHIHKGNCEDEKDLNFSGTGLE